MNFDNDEYDEKIGMLREDGRIPFRIARKLGVNREFVRFRLKKMGLPVDGRSKYEMREDIKSAYESGMTYRDMEKKFGVCHTVINYNARKWGLPRRQKEPPNDETLLKEYVDNKMPCIEIAKKYDCHFSLIHRHLVRLGVIRTMSDARELFRQRILGERGVPYIVDAQDYPRVRAPIGFQSGRIKGGMIRLHDLEMEKHLGRPIQKGEQIHHINFDKMDNRVENLYLCQSMSEHRLVHGSLERVGLELFEIGLIYFDGKRYVINPEKLEEYLASIEPSEIPDPIPRFEDSK